MKEYYFLFALAFVWTIFATVQDIKKREVANWLNFSLIAFALSYRLFFSVINKNLNFFITGVLGFAIFFGLAHALYYSKAIAGGDAKLLMGFGVILPYKNYFSLLYIPFLFIFLLFLVGSIYSLVYSISIVVKNKQKFKKQFFTLIKKFKFLIIGLLIATFVLFFADKKFSLIAFATFFGCVLFVHIKSLEICMTKLTRPNRLTEGDWLVSDVFLSGKTIKKTVHGLSKEDIRLLRKANKQVLIKVGIPFVPAFLITLVIMALFFLVLRLPVFSFVF